MVAGNTLPLICVVTHKVCGWVGCVCVSKVEHVSMSCVWHRIHRTANRKIHIYKPPRTCGCGCCCVTSFRVYCGAAGSRVHAHLRSHVKSVAAAHLSCVYVCVWKSVFLLNIVQIKCALGEALPSGPHVYVAVRWDR